MSSILESVSLTPAQSTLAAANRQASDEANVPFVTTSAGVVITLPEVFLLSWLRPDMFDAIVSATYPNVVISVVLTDLHRCAKVSSSNPGVVFACTSWSSVGEGRPGYPPFNVCYDESTGKPRPTRILFPTLMVEIEARGQQFVCSVAANPVAEMGVSSAAKSKLAVARAMATVNQPPKSENKPLTTVRATETYVAPTSTGNDDMRRLATWGFVALLIALGVAIAVNARR